MTMDGRCPSCGAVMPGHLFFEGQKTEQTYKTIAELPGGCSGPAMRYLDLFRNPQGRAMTKERELNVIRELHGLITSGWVEYKGKVARKAEPGIWKQGMEIMLERASQKRLELPMKNHNYLKSIVYDEADKADRKQEVQRNRAERTGAVKREEAHVPLDVDWMRKVREEKLGKRKGQSGQENGRGGLGGTDGQGGVSGHNGLAGKQQGGGNEHTG